MRKSIILGAIGFGMTSVFAVGATAYASYDKTVTLSVDGHDRQLHTFGETVEEVLAEQRLEISDRDLLVPSADAEVADGTHIVVRYARPLTLTVDGRKQTHWVTALNVEQALADLEVRAAGAELSASRSAGIGRSGMSVEVRTLKNVVIRHDGRSTPVRTTGITVGEAIADAGLRVDANDRLRPALEAWITDGSTIDLARVEVRHPTRDVRMPCGTIRKADSSMDKGTEKTERACRPGLKRQQLEVVFVDGERTKRSVTSEKVVRRPVDEIIRYGTRERASVSSGTSVGGSVDSLNWAALADCESSGNENAVNPAGYYGLYQFSLSTWQSVGGSGNPIDHSAGEQTYRAKLLYQREGSSPWPVCGSRLYS